MEQLQEIERYIQEGDVEALSTLLDRLTQSTDFDMLYEGAGLLAAYGFMGEADRIYETLLFHLPEEAQLKIDRANTLIELGEEDEALLLLTDVKKHDEEYIQALLALADYYQMTGMAETALSKIKEAHTLLPHEPVIQFAYAELLLESGKYSEAVRYYLELKEQVAEIGDVSITARLAETFSAGAAYEEAIPYYEEMLKDKTLPDTLFGTAFAYYQIGKAERAIKLLDELIAIDPDYYSAYMLAGQAKLLVGDDQEAYDTFSEGIIRDEYDKELQLSAGKCALKLGRPEVAEAHLKEALVLDPEYIEALITLASLYNEDERDDELVDLLSYSKDEVEEISLLHAMLAYAYERLEQYDDAYASFTKAYSGMKEDYEFLSAYASFLVEEGKRSEAIEVAQQLITLFPDNENWRAFLETQNDEGCDMTAMVPVAAKKDFVRWFLKRYKLKRRECVWILNYLLSHEVLLKNVHFTDEAHYCPRAMVISTTKSESIPFRFYKGNLMTADAEKSFHDLRLHEDEKMYIQLNFPNSHSCPNYASVREENPFLPSYLQVSETDKRIAQQLVEESIVSMTEEVLRKGIDEALDMNDEARFIALSAMLNDAVMKEIDDSNQFGGVIYSF